MPGAPVAATADDEVPPPPAPSSRAYLARLTLVAALGGLQFGWDTGIAAGMLVALHEDLGHALSATEQGVFVCATTVGAILGALIAGRLADWRGRRTAMIVSAGFFLVGCIEQAASQVLRELVLGRLLVGVGVGMTSMVVPTFLAECAPADVRGRVVGANSLLVTAGQVLAYAIAAALYHARHGWRWMVLLGALPAVAQLVGLFWLDESPRWLADKGKHSAARAGLERMYPTADGPAIQAHLDALTAGAPIRSTRDARGPLKELFTSNLGRRALLLACGLQAAQQLSGANSILYFSSRLLLMAGFSNPNAAAVGVAVANFVGTVIAVRIVDVWGRRRLLLHATAAASISLALLAFTLAHIDMGDVVDGGDGPPQTTSGWAYASLAAMIGFLFCYALGLGIVPWLVQSEVFPGHLRSVGGSIATAVNWSSNLLVSATYLDLVRLISPQGTFWLYSVIAAGSWIFTYVFLPEMAGMDLSNVTSLFSQREGGTDREGYVPIWNEEDERADDDVA